MSDHHYDSREKLAEYIWNWKHGGTSFSCLLLSMISKADPENKDRLRKAFPEMVLFYREWQASENGEEFLEKEMKWKRRK